MRLICFLFACDFDWARFLKDRLEDFEFVEFESKTRELPGVQSIKSRSFVRELESTNFCRLFFRIPDLNLLSIWSSCDSCVFRRHFGVSSGEIVARAGA